MRMPPCVLQENVPSFDRSIDTMLLESTCEEVGQDLVSKLWFSAPGPNRTAPHDTTLHRTTLNSTALAVCSWFALGSLLVLLRYGTVTVRYFNTGTVHVHVYILVYNVEKSKCVALDEVFILLRIINYYPETVNTRVLMYSLTIFPVVCHYKGNTTGQ